MIRTRRHGRSPYPWLLAVAAIGFMSVAPAPAQQISFDEAMTRLRAEDASVRLRTLRLVKESGHPEAIGPVAALVTDSDDKVQLEAIETAIHLLLTQPVATRRRVAGVVEVRQGSLVEGAFTAGPVAIAIRPVPAEVVRALLGGIRDRDASVRQQAAYALGVVAPRVAGPRDATVVAAIADALVERCEDPDAKVRLAAVRVTGRLFAPSGRRPGLSALPDTAQAGTALAGWDLTGSPTSRQALGDALIDAINDPDKAVRLAAMRALGDLGYERAVQALAEHFAYYKKGPAAGAALDALARIAHATSAPLFKSLLTHPDPLLRRLAIEGIGRLGDQAALAELDRTIGYDREDQVYLASAFALQRLGRGIYLDRLVDALDRPGTAEQARGYLIEIGSSIAPQLYSYLRDPDPRVRAAVADVVGVIGGPEAAAEVEPLLRDRDRQVAAAAERALARLK